MDAVAFILLWPFIIFTVGLALIALSEFPQFDDAASLFLIVVFLLVWLLLRGEKRATPASPADQLEGVRRLLVGGSLALLLPVFVRYLIESFPMNPLPAVIVGLFIGFFGVAFGMTVKDNTLVAKSSFLGGTLTILYVFTKISLLDEIGRVSVAALGLLLAIVVAVIKFRERLT